MKVPLTANNNNSKPSLHGNIISTAAAALPVSYEPKSVLELRGSPSPVAGKPVSVTATEILGVGAAVWDDPLQLEDDHVLINQNFDDWDSLMRDLGLHDDSAPAPPVSKPPLHLLSTEAAAAPQLNQAPSTQYIAEYPPLVNSFDSTQYVAADFGLLSDIPAYSIAAAPLNHNPAGNTINCFDGLSGDLNSCSSNWTVGFDFVDELIRLAECFETNSLQLGQAALARLNQRLRSPSGKPLQRAAFYFKEALQGLLTGSTRPTHHPANSSDIIQTIKAQKTFSSVSPIPMFASFTANQAVLEALHGSMHVHVIDFEIGLGGHWASFMKELADKAESAAPPVLRISALVPEEYAAESRLIRDNLNQFARELNIRFDIDFILIRTFEYLSLKAIRFMDGEKVAVLLSPAIFRQVGTGFLNELRRISPYVVVHVDVEGQMGFGMPSYRQAVIGGLEFYSTLMESLEAANFNGGGGSDWMRSIETFVLYPKIVEGVEAAARQGTAWREALVAAGLRQVALSQFADFQAECLIRRVQVRGFHVAKRQAEMLLCWHDRPLVATSAWRF